MIFIYIVLLGGTYGLLIGITHLAIQKYDKLSLHYKKLQVTEQAFESIEECSIDFTLNIQHLEENIEFSEILVLGKHVNENKFFITYLDIDYIIKNEEFIDRELKQINKKISIRVVRNYLIIGAILLVLIFMGNS